MTRPLAVAANRARTMCRYISVILLLYTTILQYTRNMVYTNGNTNGGVYYNILLLCCAVVGDIVRSTPRAESRTEIADFDSRVVIERGTTSTTVHFSRMPRSTVSHEIAYIIIIISIYICSLGTYDLYNIYCIPIV